MKRIKESFIPDEDSTYDAILGLSAIAWGVTQIEENIGDSNLAKYISQIDKICYEMEKYIKSEYPRGKDDKFVEEISDNIHKALFKYS